jgi:hypothetical protein
MMKVLRHLVSAAMLVLLPSALALLLLLSLLLHWQPTPQPSPCLNHTNSAQRNQKLLINQTSNACYAGWADSDSDAKAPADPPPAGACDASAPVQPDIITHRTERMQVCSYSNSSILAVRTAVHLW